MIMHCLLSLSLLVLCFIQSATPIADTTRQSSVYNNYTSDLAVDNDVSTCSVTGFETDAWWVLDLEKLVKVNGLRMIGWSNPIHVRVGNQSETLATRRSFDNNAWCALHMGLSASDEQLVTCARPIQGRYVSVQTVDNLLFGQLRLCDVTVY